MRRPPDKDGQPALSERDVDSSNATLNTLFGGVRQKSWMVGAGNPVRPTPRANTSRTTLPPVAMAQKNATTVFPSPAPSDEPSPRISNVTVNGGNNRGQGVGGNDGNRRSSTTNPNLNRHTSHTFPSEADNPSRSGPRVTETRPRSSSSNNRFQNQVGQQSAISPQINGDFQPSMTELPPLPSSVLLPSYQQDQIQIQQGHLPQGQGQIASHEQVQSPVQLASPSAPGQSPQQNQANLFRSRSQGSGHLQGRSERNQLPSPAQTNILSPRVISDLPMPSTMVPNQAQSSTSTGTFRSTAPHKRQRTQAAAMPSLKPRIAMIDAHIEASGGQNNLNAVLEKPRFQLLREACNSEDAFYVALHQVFCIRDFDQVEIDRIPSFPEPHFLFAAFKIMGQLIQDNEQLAPNHKRWFATFPSPLNLLLGTSEPYRRTLREVGFFLGRLAVEWAPMTAECRARGYPPLVDELVDRLGLLSPIFQRVVFTASRRMLGIGEGEVGARAENLFRKDQTDHQALAARYNTNRPPTAREVIDRNNALVGEYLAIQQLLIQPRRTSGSPLIQMPMPVVPSNGHPQSGPQVAMPWQQAQQQASLARNQSKASSNQGGNWQFSNQQPQMMGRTTAGFPNPSAMAGRPPSIGAQPTYTNNTPSPTLLQGLSMQSAVQQGFQVSPAGRSNSVQMQTAQIGSAYAGHNGAVYQDGVQNVDPSLQQRNHMVMQQQQAAQHQAVPQHRFSPQQLQQTLQHQQQQAAFQQYQQQQLQQQALAQQVVNLNRTAQLRQGSNGAVDLQTHPGTNSISSGGRRTPGARPVPSPRPNPASIPGPRRAQPTFRDPRQELVAYEQMPPLNRPIVPPMGYIHSGPVQPDMTALHQAHLRSPLLVSADASPVNIDGNKATRWYQAVRDFALDPVKIPTNTPLSKFEFGVSQADFVSIAKDGPPNSIQLATRSFRRGTLQYRLRCVQMKKSDVMRSTSEWIVSDTVWPESACLEINKNHLEIRRKNHYGKDLPIDITAHVRALGPNSINRITLSITRGRAKLKEFNYFLAVETVEVLQHDQILEMCLQQRIPKDETLDKIKRSLAALDSDDDIAMVSSDLSLDVADPFTAKLFETPVRGSSCVHRECFDLETFLLTRNTKPKRPHQPSMVDVWKCPLCFSDCRPYSLQIDEFLASVRATLVAQDNLDVKAILISADGSWRPKEIPRSSVKRSHPYDEDSSDDDGPLAQRATSVVAQKAVEIIDLDDD